MNELNLKAQQVIDSVEQFQFEHEPIKGYPELRWAGKRPFRSTQYFPAQLKESYGNDVDGWMNKIFWGDNLQVMSHLLKQYRGQVDLIYIDPPFDSKADYKRQIDIKGNKTASDSSSFEEKQYTDIWVNDEYLQFMYERLIIMRELLSERGSIYVHMDENKNYLVRSIMDSVFGPNNFKREIIWRIGWISGYKSKANQWIRNHDTILYYTKSSAFTFNKKYIPYPEGYRRRDGGIPEGEGYPIEDTWNCSELDSLNSIQIMSFSGEKVGYPTQKNESLLERIIECSSNPGDLIFDCFMGSGTTQAVAMKMGRRFIGADINLGSVDTTVKRLLKIQDSLNNTTLFSEGSVNPPKIYSGFEVYNVNNYDIFRNPVEAKELLIKALELQQFPGNTLYDGELDGRMYKIMPVNRIATRADLNELITNFPYAIFNKRTEENPSKPVEFITLVCMGHEPDLGSSLKLELKKAGYNIDVEVVDILRDKSNLEFKRDSEADVKVKDGKLIIEDFYPMNLLQKLSLQKESIDNWRVLVDSVKVDFNYDDSVFSPTLIDIPEKKEDTVKGIYSIPKAATKIRVKITDLLCESIEKTINV